MRTAGRVGALAAAVALPVLLALRWFAVPRLVDCAFGCYSPIAAYGKPEPVGPDIAPGTFHASTGWGSLPWPVIALVVAATLAGILVAARPRWSRLGTVLGALALVVVAVVSFVAQPGLDPRWPLVASPGVPRGELDAFLAQLPPVPPLTDAMIDVRWPAYVGAGALALLVLASHAAGRRTSTHPT